MTGTVTLGGVLTAPDALGHAPLSNWTGTPRPGNDFRTRYAEDLSLMAELGVNAVRLGFDWSRLEPRPGEVDDDWREWYQHVLDRAHERGVDVWATLHESTVPRWFDDAGSFGDERAAGRWWPRWVERCADLFGDRVAGWFPIHDPIGAADPWRADRQHYERALVHVAVAWRDAWRVLRGGPPVATSLHGVLPRAADRTVPAAQAARDEDRLRWRLWLTGLRDGTLRLPSGDERQIPDLAGALDVLGVSTVLDHPEADLSDDSVRQWEERLGTVLRRVAEEGPDRPLVVSALRVTWTNDAERTLLVEAATRAVQRAVADGVRVQRVFVDPAIGSPPAAALLTRDRERATAAWWV